jgi:hypothetical protein
MSILSKEADEYLDEYRAAGPEIRNRKRNICCYEYYKWEAIRDGIRKIDLEEAV